MKNQMKRLFALLLAVMMIMTVVGCAKKGVDDDKMYTYNYYLSQSPSNWNELTYQDANDTEIMSYIGSSFFTYDFKYDEDGEIIPGEFTMQYSAATKLEDVTANYVGEKWGIAEGETGKAYKITLRNDLKWDDGTAIKAEDFVYSMQQQLNPLFQNYRADSFYVGSTVIIGAKDYAKQGQSGWFTASDAYSVYSEDLDTKLVFTLGPDQAAHSFIRDYVGFPDTYDLATTVQYLVDNMGFTCTPEEIAQIEGKTLAEIKADASLKAIWEKALGWWQTEPNEELHFFAAEYTYPEYSWEDVGIFVGNTEYEIVVVLENALDLLNEDGSLSYKAAYNFSSLPLVHKATYEANKVEPTAGSDLWTTTYNTSAESTMSWGPYKLESYQAGKQHVLVKNDQWFGYALEENEGLYQTDRIVCEIVKDWNSAWVLFRAGKVDGISIDVSIADDYKTSSRAYFTPSDFVSSLQLQSDAEALKSREEEGVNKTLLTYTSFRQALSLSINRAEFTQTCTTASKEGFGLFNSMHYYDVANGGVYRNTDEGKQALCDVYGVDVSKYASLDEAVASITGYNLELARQKLTEAYNEALAAGDIKATDTVKLVFGSGSITESVTRQFNYIKASWETLCQGTPLEGRIELTIEDKGDNWAKDFRAGAYDVCMGGWSGAAWDPGYFLLAYLDEGYRYAKGWDTTKAMMTFTMKGVGENGEDITETMSLMDWYNCLNGVSGAKYDWSSNGLEESQRLQLIAALETEVLKTYYAVPLANSFSASMLSYKVDYITYEYNTFMGYGGMKYMKYNYDDAAWEALVAEQDDELDYKK